MIAVVYAAVFAIYNIIVLLAFGDKNNIFWASYAFMAIAFIVNIGAVLYSFKSTDVEAMFMNIPLASLSVFYFFAELFISFVFMLFRKHVGIKLTVSTQVIFLLMFIIVAVIAIMSRDAVQSINKEVETKVRNLKNLSVDVKMIEMQCTDSELKNELHKIEETIRYSDPMTNDSIAELDDMIKAKIVELKYLCSNNNKSEAMQACNQLKSFLAERKQRLILTK
jgi:hypothetical protein